MNGAGTSTTSTSGGWGGQDAQILASGEDDFQQFIDMSGMGALSENFSFDFGTEFQATNGAGSMMQPVGQSSTDIDTIMTGTGVGTTSMKTTISMPPVSAAHLVSPVDPIINIDAEIQMLQNQKLQLQEQQREQQRHQMHLQNQQHQARQVQQQQNQQRRLEEQQTLLFNQQNRIVPPTPQSAELHKSTSQMYRPDQGPSVQQAIYDQFHRLREAQDLSFTPLVSPAVTPLETHFQPENQFAVNSACFSPISSPAIHAQNDNISYDHRMAGLSVNSPVDVVMQPSPNLTGNPQLSADSVNKRKARNPASSKSMAKSIRQSPITKAQKKRTASTPSIAKHIIDDIVENASKGQISFAGMLPGPAQTAVSTDTSENSSISPEHITEMLPPPPPPPPQPQSAKQSPTMPPQKNGQIPLAYSSSGFSPATPASLMRLPSPSIDNSNNIANGADLIIPEGIDKLELPESITSKSKFATTSQLSQQRSPDQKTPKGTVAPSMPSPVFVRPSGTASASQSPQIAPSVSRKTLHLAPRNNKKRSSASVQSSPALRPKISPSIKPLLPGGVGLSAEDTASQLLATKSNYQNILEGNKVPGITYSTDVLTNLTSKRTSHKIAEQGRRNRINTALQEIATLLPQDDKLVDNEKKDAKTGNLPNSKASTVEMAIEYIKELKKQVESEKRRADTAEKMLHELESAS